MRPRLLLGGEEHAQLHAFGGVGARRRAHAAAAFGDVFVAQPAPDVGEQRARARVKPRGAAFFVRAVKRRRRFRRRGDDDVLCLFVVHVVDTKLIL